MVLRRRIGEIIVQHAKENIGLYLAIGSIFIIGVILGTIAVEALDANQKGQLIQYLDWFLGELNRWEIDTTQVAIQNIVRNLESVGLIAFLGLTVIGAPLILLVILIRGFVLGFTVGFLVEEKAVAGILMAVTSILPQNLFNIPAWLLAGVVAGSFSMMLVRENKGKVGKNFWHNLFSYLSVMGILALLVTIGALVETYISPVFLRLLAGYIQ